MTTATAERGRGTSPTVAWFTTGLLTVMYAFSLMDRQIMSLMVGPVRADLNGKSVMGLVYAPIPLPVLDVFGKAGYTRLDGSLTVNSSTAQRTSLNDNAFTYGAGVQVKFAGWGIRGEYERFSASGRDPSLWTVSLAKHFF